MKDKISIIVPVYKVEQYIERCVNSILKQTYKNIEVILVDDGSPDNCGIICDKFSAKDKRVKVIHTKNGGLSAARNVGIQNASGRYLMFVDSDDYIMYDMVDYLYNLLIKNKCDISICNYVCTYDDSKLNDIIGVDGKFEYVFDTEEALNKLLLDKDIKSFAWNKMYKASLFKNVRFPEKRVMEDLGTTYKLFMKSNKIVFGSEPKYYYVQRNGSILHNKKSNFYIDFYELAYDRFLNINLKYESMKINYVTMLYISFNFILVKNSDVQKYIVENDIIKRIKKLIKEIKKLNIDVTGNTKLKLLFFNLNVGLFKFLFRGWNKWILKKEDSM